MKLTVNGTIVEIPDVVSVYSHQQYKDAMDTIVYLEENFKSAGVTEEDKTRAYIRQIFPLLAAHIVQPIMDKGYNYDRVVEIWPSLKNHPEEDKVLILAVALIVSAGQHLVLDCTQEVRKLIKSIIDKNSN